MGNLMVRLHIRLRLTVVLFFAFSFVLLWFVRSNSCRSYITTWGGMLPLQARPSFCVTSHAALCCVLLDCFHVVFCCAAQKSVSCVSCKLLLDMA